MFEVKPAAVCLPEEVERLASPSPLHHSQSFFGLRVCAWGQLANLH